MTALSWSIPGSDGEPILGDTHLPPADVKPRGVLLICHGFKGYKDYGILPGIAHYAAMRGFIAHRFNFSHSGMTNNVETFERPDLFEEDTWGKQVFDLRAVAMAAGEGLGLEAWGLGEGHTTSRQPRASSPSSSSPKPQAASHPQIWYGHSRGGVTALITAARAFAPTKYPRVGAMPKPAGVIACASPHRAFWLSDEDKQTLYRQGYLDSPSSRTKQVLRVGLPWLKEIEQQPEAFDPVVAVKRISCPVLIIHGTEDMTVGLDSADKLAAAAPHARLEIVEGATHVFNTSNPMKLEREPSPQGKALIDLVCGFCERVVG